MWLALLGTALGTRAFGLPLPLADLALLAFVPWAALLLWRQRAWSWPPWTPALGAFVAAGLLSGVAAWLAGGASFQPIEFLKSFAKLLLYATSAALLWQLARAAGPASTTRVVAGAFALAGVVGLALYALQLGGTQLPRTLACGEHPQTCSALYYERRWLGDASPEGLEHDVFLRAQGLAAEPTRFGYLQAMALGFLLLWPGARPAALRAALVAVSALLSFSLAAYGLLAALLLLGLFRTHGRAGRARRLTGALSLGLFLVMLLHPATRATLERAVLARVARLQAGAGDPSADLRLRSSWTLGLRLMAMHPLTGVGLGNYDVGVRAVRPEFPERRYLTGSIEGWNALAYVVATTGLLGTLAFLLLLLAALGARPALLALFALSLFADGSLLSAPFWVFLALYAVPPPLD
jgi:O-antigen ligase